MGPNTEACFQWTNSSAVDNLPARDGKEAGDAQHSKASRLSVIAVTLADASRANIIAGEC